MFMRIGSKLFDWECWLFCCVTFAFRCFTGCSTRPVSSVTGSRAYSGRETKAKSPHWAMVKYSSQSQAGVRHVHGGSQEVVRLAALILWPVMGFGQEFIEHPENATVCVGESAEFTSETAGGIIGWNIDGVLRQNLPFRRKELIPIGTLIVNFNQTFNGLEVQSVVLKDGGSITSNSAYLFYESNHQSQVTGLTHTITNTTAQFYWNELESNLTTQYLFGVYDGDNNLIANQTTDATQISYDLPPRANDTCQYLEFKVTADVCPDPETGFVQNEAATLVYREPNIDLSPVTAEFDNQTVWVNWTPAGSGAYWVSFVGLGFGASDPRFSYTPALCGQYNLNVSVSPAQCAGDPGFTHSATVSFTIPCPTTPTGAGATGQPSGTQASYPSVLLAVAAMVPLLRIARPAF